MREDRRGGRAAQYNIAQTVLKKKKKGTSYHLRHVYRSSLTE